MKNEDDNVMSITIIIIMRTQVRRVRGEERRGREELWVQIRSGL